MAGNFGKNYDVLESDLLLTTKEIAIKTGIKTYPMSGTGTGDSAEAYTDKVVNYAFFDAVAFQILGDVKGAFAGIMTPNTKELVIPAFLVHWIVAHQQAKQTAQNIITTYNLASVVVPALRAGAALRVFMLVEGALGVVVDNPSANFTSYLDNPANEELKTAFEGVVSIFRLAQLANGSFSTAKIKALNDIWYKYASLNGVANTEYVKIQEFLSGGATADELKYWNKYLTANTFTTVTAPTTISLFVSTYREIKDTKGFTDIKKVLEKAAISGDVFRLEKLLDYTKGANNAERIARVKGLLINTTNTLLVPRDYVFFKKMVDDYLPHFRQDTISPAKPAYFAQSNKFFDDINMQHILDKHTAEYFSFDANGVNKAITMFPIGTTQMQILAYIDEALGILKNNPAKGASYPLFDDPENVTLSNGMEVTIGSRRGDLIENAPKDTYNINQKIIGMFFPLKTPTSILPISVPSGQLEVLKAILR